MGNALDEIFRWESGHYTTSDSDFENEALELPGLNMTVRDAFNAVTGVNHPLDELQHAMDDLLRDHIRADGQARAQGDVDTDV